MEASINECLKCSANPCVLTATKPFNGVLRIAMLPAHPQAAHVLDAGRNIYPVAGTIQYEQQDNKYHIFICPVTSKLVPFLCRLHFTYNYKVEKMRKEETDGCLLMLALSHHRELNLQELVPLIGDKEWYRAIKGPMFGVQGEKWNMSIEVPTISWWDDQQPIDPKKREIIRGALYAEATISIENTDTYAFGKRLAAIGRLAIIADQLEEIALAKMIRDRMKRFIAPWIKGENSNPFVYDPFWGGIISKNGAQDKHADFGNGMYNDHHFQYGYFVYAAAVIGKGDRSWLEKYLHQVMDLVRDYGNPSSKDLYFPKARHFDFYLGHSWASGVFCFPDGKNQESTSEAIHAYYALSLLGQVLEKEELAQFGCLLCSLEIISTRHYWHIPELHNSPIYPAPFCQNAVVGILWSGKVDYSTWFGSNWEYIHGIQMLPFVPISHHYMKKEWIAKVMRRIGHLLRDVNVEDSWKGYLWMANAVISKEASWHGFKILQGAPDEGNTVTNALYWIATRPSNEQTSQSC